MDHLNEDSFEGAKERAFEDDDFIPSDAKPVCPKCFRAYDPQAYYCPYCDANDTINPLTTYMPYIRIRFIYGFFGKMWNVIWYGKKASVLLRALCFFLMLIFVPYILILGFPFVLIRKFAPVSMRDSLNKVFSILVFIIFLLLLLLSSWWAFSS